MGYGTTPSLVLVRTGTEEVTVRRQAQAGPAVGRRLWNPSTEGSLAQAFSEAERAGLGARSPWVSQDVRRARA